MRQGQDRVLAFALAGLVLWALWLGAGQAYLKRKPVALRILPVEEGFVLSSNREPARPATLPRPAVLQRRTITVERSERTHTETPVSRRIPNGGQRLQAALYEEAIALPTAPLLHMQPPPKRHAGGLTLEAGQLTHEVQSSADSPVRRTPVVHRRETLEQRVAGPGPERAQPVAMREITRWMRLQPSELPPGIRRHVEFQPENLTATAAWVDHGEVYEIYMLVRVPLRELHVVIVHGDETWYLIDRSFERQGRSFRAGYARRAGGVITGVVSEERAAASREAAAFYNIFLTWWDQERLKLP
ncbi:MAG: hypothetical protein OXM02_04880 [Bacteroidota bacterium]|nr:hypothetical protein [Bacteroidota bacterium]MDE2957407.1 hypothetical protein [Bacteroidota bacterium]